jgi:hypothetical protein
VKTDTVDGALAPALTNWDLRVLAATPPEPEPWTRECIRATEVSAWQIAEALHEEDVKMVRETLNGLAIRHLVYRWGGGWQLHRHRWTRTRQGTDYLSKEAA